MSRKKVDWAKYHNRHSSKSIWVIKLSFCQNDSPMGNSFFQPYVICSRDWSPKFETGLNMIIGCTLKSIWVIKLSFCQNDSPMEETFWQKDSLITHILFELWLIMLFSPVANFAQQSLHSFTNFQIPWLFHRPDGYHCPANWICISNERLCHVFWWYASHLWHRLPANLEQFPRSNEGHYHLQSRLEQPDQSTLHSKIQCQSLLWSCFGLQSTKDQGS